MDGRDDQSSDSCWYFSGVYPRVWRDLHPDRVVGVMVGGMAVVHAMVQGDERRNGKNPKTASNL
jgi:hypothetical protein